MTQSIPFSELVVVALGFFTKMYSSYTTRSTSSKSQHVFKYMSKLYMTVFCNLYFSFFIRSAGSSFPVSFTLRPGPLCPPPMVTTSGPPSRGSTMRRTAGWSRRLIVFVEKKGRIARSTCHFCPLLPLGFQNIFVDPNIWCSFSTMTRRGHLV